MNKTKEDMEFMHLLKDNTPETAENPWFTRKVMNRLPQKHSHATFWVSVIGYGLCTLLVILCWCSYFIHLNVNLITKGDALAFFAMLSFSSYLVFLAINSAIKRQDSI